jgi:hypothetical protein
VQCIAILPNQQDFHLGDKGDDGGGFGVVNLQPPCHPAILQEHFIKVS